jgi:arabinogalactan endo-1,4-beta-galactosidase
MLWPISRVDVDIEPMSALVANFSNPATLYKSARAGVDDAVDAVDAGVKMPEVLIRIDNGWNITLRQRWFGALVANGVKTTDWTAFGFSFYPLYSTSARFTNLKNSLYTLAEQYRKPLQVVETDYPAICNGQQEPIPTSSEPKIPYNIQGRTTWVDDVIEIVKGAPYGLGRGVHYWEPAWLNNTNLGSNCSDAILFTADYSAYPRTVGYSRSSVDMFCERD